MYGRDFLSERAPDINKPKIVKKNNQRENGKNWSRFPGGCLIPRQTGLRTVGRNITLTLTLTLAMATTFPPSFSHSIIGLVSSTIDIESLNKKVNCLSNVFGSAHCFVILLSTELSYF
jgi:hypothetical protein